ncbi:MAG: metal-dependent hydrolase, partial [Chloroflexota bacterium]
MPQAGIHGLVGLAVRKWVPDRKWLFLGIVLGNFLPDADNFVVAVATVTGGVTEGLHRTFTHSLVTITVIILLSTLLGKLLNKKDWGNLGVGLGIGMLMHVGLDLVMWFNGVDLLWPLAFNLNLWEGVTPALWWSKLMQPAELLAFAVFLMMLRNAAQKQGTNPDLMKPLNTCITVISVLF